MSESGDTTQIPTPHVADTETAGDDDLYGSESGEVILKTRDTPQDPITRNDIREIINGWEEKFNKMTEGVRALELNTNEVHTHMDVVMRENRASESAQLSTNRQIKFIQEALARFMDTCDPARQTPVCTFVQPCAPTMSTPITPMGALPEFRSEFSFASPVIQTTPAEPTRGDRGRDLNERPTHENGNGNGGDTQQLTMNTSSGLKKHAIHRALKCQYLMERCQHIFAPGSCSSRPSRATNAGRPGRKWHAWWHL